jgi:Carbohydrate-selective porin, OprB family/S-layer homology domain
VLGGLTPAAIVSPDIAPTSATPTSTTPTPLRPTQHRLAQVTSVDDLTDVQPTDWAYQALQSLVERYGCIAGYPDRTYRGNRALTRYEFAAGLNACLDRLAELLPESSEPDADLETINRLQRDFAEELALLGGRVDALEARTADLEAQQFSPTTTFSGFAIIGLQGRSSNQADLAPRDGKPDLDDPGSQANLINLNLLSFTTNFTPRSYLLTSLLVGQGSGFPRLTFDGILGYEFPTDGWQIADLRYHALIADNFAVAVGTEGVSMLSMFRGPNREESAATGPLSFFAQRNPILDIGFGRTGAAFDWQFARRASLQAVYSVNTKESPGTTGSLSDGNTTTGVQLLLTPIDPVDVSLYYVNNYSPNGCLLTFIGDDCLTANNPQIGKSAALQTNAIGATVNWQISPHVTLGAWGGYTTSEIPGEKGNVETTNYMFYLNFPDLFADGNLGGIYVGQPLKIISSDLPEGNNVPDFLDTGRGRSGGQPGTTIHLEAFYRFQLTDDISLTPGVIHEIDPGHTPDSDSITIGVLRTTFFF